MLKIIEDNMRDDPQVNNEVSLASSWCGRDVSGFPQSVLVKVTSQLQQEFAAEAEGWTLQDHSQNHANLMEAIGKRAGDPERALFNWLRTGTPTGAAEEAIQAHGIFPAVAGPSAAVEKSRRFAQMRQRADFQDTPGNYQPFYQEDGAPAQDEINRLHECGFIAFF